MAFLQSTSHGVRGVPLKLLSTQTEEEKRMEDLPVSLSVSESLLQIKQVLYSYKPLQTTLTDRCVHYTVPI